MEVDFVGCECSNDEMVISSNCFAGLIYVLSGKSKKEKINMNKTEIFEFLNANPVFHLATIDGGRPCVRGMLLYSADENGIVFHTGKMRDLHKQLTEKPVQVFRHFIAAY